MIKMDSKAFQESVKALADIYEKMLVIAVMKASEAFLTRIVMNNPLGDDQFYARLYKERQESSGYDPRQGLSKGSWITELNAITPEREGLYDSTGAGKAITLTFKTEMRNFKLGDVIYFHNSVDYIESPQVDGDKLVANAYAQRDAILKRAFSEARSYIKKEISKAKGI
jgi:hypothetical protein